MILSTLERRQSPENPSTPLSNPASWLFTALGLGPSKSGVNVTQETALTLDAAYACIDALSKDVAQIPFVVYRRDGTDRARAGDHRVFGLLHQRPNPAMSPSTFKRTLQSHAVSWGNGWAEIERREGTPHALWPLRPDRTRAVLRGGRKVVITRDAAGEEKALPGENVLHIPGLGYDGLMGRSVIGVAREAIGMGLAAQEYSARFFSNSAIPPAVIKHPQQLGDPARQNIRKSWQEMHGGLSNQFRVGILDEGMDIETIGLPAKDTEFIQAGHLTVERMCRFFDVPPQRIHHLQQTTAWGTGVAEFKLAYLTHSVGPWLVEWEEAVNWQLFTEPERQIYFAEFLREAFLMGDQKARGEFYRVLFGVGGISPNEIARRENLPAQPGGEKRYVPLNMIPLDQAADGFSFGERGTPELPAPSGPAERREAVEAVPARARRTVATRRRLMLAYRQVFLALARRLVRRETSAARAALMSSSSRDEFLSWMRRWYPEHESWVREQVRPVVGDYGAAVFELALDEVEEDSDTDLELQAERFFDEYAETVAQRGRISSERQLEGILEEPDWQAGVEQRLAEWDERRPGKIADREPVQAGAAVAKLAFVVAGIRRLIWVSNPTACPLCRLMDGKVVGIEEPFAREGDVLDPDDGETEPLHVKRTTFHPQLHGGCECGLAAA